MLPVPLEVAHVQQHPSAAASASAATVVSAVSQNGPIHLRAAGCDLYQPAACRPTVPSACART